MSNAAKNEKIKQAMQATREKHKNMTCRVFELKLNSRKMSKTQKEQLTTYFREAKWRRNNIVADFAKASRNAKSATVKVGDAFEERPFIILGSQVIQDIYDNIKAEMKGLHTKKEKGEKVGKLKFKSVCNCIPLRQYNTTYRIDFVRRLVRIQNIRKSFTVYGLEQIPPEAEDEMIHNWQAGLFGRRVQHSAMGYIKAKLKTNLKTYVVSRSYPSTQICPACGQKTKQPLKKRDYDCSYCGWHHASRDVKSAQSILLRALYEVNVSPEQRAKSFVEADTATQVLQSMLCKYSPMKQEAQVL